MEYVAFAVAVVALVMAFFAARELRTMESENDLEFEVLHERIDGAEGLQNVSSQRIDLARADIERAFVEISKRALSRRGRKTILPPAPGEAANDNDEVTELTEADLLDEDWK